MLLLGLAPLLRYGLEFHLGYTVQPYGFLYEGDVFSTLLFPIPIGIAIGLLAPVQRILLRSGIGLGAIFLSGTLALFAAPGGAVAYTQGFTHRIHQEIAAGDLPHWAQDTLKRYAAGSPEPIQTPAYWDPGDLGFAPENLPSFLKSGIFQPSGIENDGPEVSLGKAGGRLGANGLCLVISWYNHGLIMGSPDLTLQWNPFYCKSVSPGLYIYHTSK